MSLLRWMVVGALGAVLAVGTSIAAADPAAGEFTPTGQLITPTAAPGALFQALNPDLPADPAFTAGQAAALARSPDGKTLLILTSGFNRAFGPDGKFIADRSMEYVFVYDVSGAAPAKRQVIEIPNSFYGIAWSPAGDRFYVSGGVDDDVMEFVGPAGAMKLTRTMALGHRAGLGLSTKPEAAGLAVSPDGRRLLVANLQNDSVSLIDLASAAVSEFDLRPGVIEPAHAGEAGGSFPEAVAWASDTRAYVASERDREVIALDVGASGPRVAGRIATRGEPAALLVSQAGDRLYAALDNTDGAAVIDTASNKLIETIPTAGPAALLGDARRLGGAGSNGLALAPDGRTLLVTNGGENAVAVVALSPLDAGKASAGRAPAEAENLPVRGDSEVVALIPTGWYPTAVAVAADGARLFVINGKSNAGPNPGNCRNSLSLDPSEEHACKATNTYVWQLQKAGFLTFPSPSPAQLADLTRQVAANNHLGEAPSAADAQTMAFLRAHIRHVIYIVKENRTYDQVLGDLEVGNGDPKLTIFGRAMTPNQHALARDFVDLDAFYDSGESSNTGWNWTTAARTNDFTEREAPVNYAERGLQYDQEGDNRNINVGLATSAERQKINPLNPADPNLLPGAVDVAAPDGPDGAAGAGYIWDSALRAGLTLRNWGFYGDLLRYEAAVGPALRTPREREPWKTGLTVFYTTKPALMGLTDPYFRGFDQAFPDYWRFKEWEREFDGFVASGKAPNLMLLRLAHDHTGGFGEALDGLNTVETELADNDYALGLVVQKVAASPFAKDTLIFVVEDDAQDGPDHVDAHRSIAFVAGPYVKLGVVVSRRFTTVSLVKTMEAVLGLAPMGITDGLAAPMTDVFDTGQSSWSYEAKVPAVLRTTQLPLPPAKLGEACVVRPAHSAAYWARAMAGQDFSQEDRLDTAAYNRALWRGLKGDVPYPRARDGRDLSQGRALLIGVAHDDGCGG
ncbi:MAG: hypothetical protein ACHP84_07835 [Caulobacterales bacterium]